MKPELSKEERRIVNGIISLKGNASQKLIAKKAEMSTATASKYLAKLEGRGIIKADRSKLPYVFWEIVNEDVL